MFNKKVAENERAINDKSGDGSSPRYHTKVTMLLPGSSYVKKVLPHAI